MTPDLAYLAEVVPLLNTQKINLPTGDNVLISHAGSVPFTAWSCFKECLMCAKIQI